MSLPYMRREDHISFFSNKLQDRHLNCNNKGNASYYDGNDIDEIHFCNLLYNYLSKCKCGTWRLLSDEEGFFYLLTCEGVSALHQTS